MASEKIELERIGWYLAVKKSGKVPDEPRYVSAPIHAAQYIPREPRKDTAAGVAEH